MKKKDFELIASAINGYNPKIDISSVRFHYDSCINDLSVEIASKLASKYPRFDKEKFLQACGVETLRSHPMAHYIDCRLDDYGYCKACGYTDRKIKDVWISPKGKETKVVPYSNRDN